MSERKEYECPKGHWIASKSPMTTCPAMKHGKPCMAELKPIGKGSRAAAKAS